MSEHKFKAFLLSRPGRWTENQSKKFVDLALGDQELPDAKSWEELEAYLVRGDEGAEEGAIDEARYIWGLYEVLGKAD